MIIKAVTSEEMREIDRISIEEIGIPATVLMNNAGRAVAEFVEKKFIDKTITIFCGTGNNGGDGFTAAYYLVNKGLSPHIYLSGKKTKVTDTSKVFMNLCEKMNLLIHEIDLQNISEISLHSNGVIIDALFGTGFTGSAAGVADQIIKLVNDTDSTVVSIDIPSGLSSDGETPSGNFIHADYTITIGLPKISLVTYPCKQFCGELILIDIGFPAFLTSDKRIKVALINESLFRTFGIFNTRSEDIHKGDKGHTLIIGGFENMEGAAILAASALFHTGCGLVTIATTEESRKIISGRISEAMTLSLPVDLDSPELAVLLNSGKFRSLIIGPGLGRSLYSEKIFKNIMLSLDKKIIKRVLIDGDGLFFLSDYLKYGKLSGEIDFIITPHFMEASRILKKDIDYIRNNRLKSCIELSLMTGCTVVLKGPSSIVSDGDNSYINTTGNIGLATAGSGDVLSGIIGALLNFEITPIDAAAAGVYIHGLCADFYGETEVTLTMSSSDIITNIRKVLSSLLITETKR